MAVTTAVIRAAANTSTGTQSFTSSGFGTPKAAIVIVTDATANATETTEGVLSVGFTDGTNDALASAIFSDDSGGGGSSSRTYDRSNTTDLVNIIANANGTNALGVFDSWATDGITIDWTTAPASAYLVTVILFGGTDTSATVGTSTHNGGDITSVGFESDLVFFTTTSASGGGTSNGAIGFGVVANDGSATQGGVGMSARHSQSTSKADIILDTQAASSQLFNDGLGSETVVSAFDSTGFTLTGGSAECHYLALNFGGVAGAWVGNIQAPGTATTEDTTGLGWTPQIVGVIGAATTITDSVQTTAANGASSISIGVSVDGGNEFSNAIRHEDGVSTMSHGSISDAVMIDINDPDGTGLEVGTVQSFDSDGFTIDYSTSTTAIEMIAWAIEGAASAATLTGTTASSTVAPADVGAVPADGTTAAGTVATLGLGAVSADGTTSTTSVAPASVGAVGADGTTTSTTAAPLDVGSIPMDGTTTTSTVGALGIAAATLDGATTSSTVAPADVGAVVVDGATTSTTIANLEPVATGATLTGTTSSTTAGTMGVGSVPLDATTIAPTVGVLPAGAAILTGLVSDGTVAAAAVTISMDAVMAATLTAELDVGSVGMNATLIQPVSANLALPTTAGPIGGWTATTQDSTWTATTADTTWEVTE